MDIFEIINKFSESKKFDQLLLNKSATNNLIVKLNKVLTSQTLYQHCCIYTSKQNDVLRYSDLAKRCSLLAPKGLKRFTAITDENLKKEDPKQLLINDAINIFTALDKITDYKHNFVVKIKDKINLINFVNDETRSVIGIKKGKLYLNVNYQPIVNNRTALPHELWHAIDERYCNYGAYVQKKIRRVSFLNNLRTDYIISKRLENGEKFIDMISPLNDKYYDDQFVSEIGSMFIDKISRDYLISHYSKDEKFCKNLIKSEKAIPNIIIKRARESYLDSLIVLLVAGKTSKIKEYALAEIIKYTNILWDNKLLNAKLNQLCEVVDGKDRFVPMYEFRYVIGEIISEEIHKRFKDANSITDITQSIKEKSKIISQITKINENICNIYKLKNKSSNANNQVDIITEFLRIEPIEKLFENYIYDTEKFIYE